jgi:pimeloyl-ACP methyl ester carboxylesterase
VNCINRPLSAVALATLLAACGGGGDESANASDPTPATPTRGSLLAGSPSKRASFSAAQLVAMVAIDDANPVAAALSLAPKCSIDVYDLKYGTVGAKAEAVTASGALMIPSGSDPACTGPRPILLYAHGTTTDRTANIADLTDPDNNEGVLMAAVFAGNGYIVVAPNYAGYSDSSLTYHAYLNADQQSKDMIDALAAARAATVVTDGGKLFITGYSQGGYVAMATHRAMQAAGNTVTASSPMSGPYALSAFGDAIFQGRVAGSAPVNLTLLISGYQNAYGDLFTNATEVFEAKYVTGIDSLLPTTTLFSSTPPAPEFASITPATQPTVTDGLPPVNPAHPLRRALKTNDLRTWVPNVPVQLCAGSEDPTVFFFNTQLIRQYWAANSPPAAITVLDVETQSAFTTAKALLRIASGDSAVLANYHAGLVPPFCLAATKSFFDGL